MPSTTTIPKLLIFSDLDGTLLDRKTYSFEPALPALQVIRMKRIPLILSSSKTRAEMERYRKRLENDHPFISENGGAVFVPKGYFSFPFPYDRESDDYLVLELGTFYLKILEVLRAVKDETGLSIKGFSDLTAEEISVRCGLGLEEAGLAKMREYDEPFLLEGGTGEVEMVRRKIEEKGMTYVWGGQFHHLLGRNDKGKAVEILKELYVREFSSVSSVAIGDSLNDIPMLLVVDHPIFLKEREEGGPEILCRNLTSYRGAGPSVWNEAILHLLNRLKA
jgi:mannosyl-3-phosphoglycerate phosphatase